MKGIVVFDTSYGNTKTIAEAISETLKESGIEVDAKTARTAITMSNSIRVKSLLSPS